MQATALFWDANWLLEVENNEIDFMIFVDAK